MSGPLAFLYKDQDKVPESKKSNLSFLYDNQPQAQSQGFLSYIGNVGKNLWQVDGVREKMNRESRGVPQQYSAEEKSIRDALVLGHQAKSAGSSIGMMDFVNFFGKMFSDNVNQVKKIIQSPSEAASSFTQDPVGFLGQMGKSLVTPLGDLFEYSRGVSLGEDKVRPLSPEEEAQRFKSTVALGVSAAVGSGIATAFGAAEGTVAETSGLAAKGALSHRILKSSSIAAASGAAYGLTAHANENDQLSEAVINGVVFAPIGVALDLLFPDKPKRATDVAQTRQVQTQPEMSFKGATQQVEALSSATDLAQSIIEGKIGVDDNSAVHVPGVDPSRIGELSKRVPPNFRTAIHHWPDGTADLLIHDSRLGLDERHFEKHGFLPDQKVSWQGSDWAIGSVDKESFTLKDGDRELKVPKEQVRQLTDVQIANRDASLTQLYGDWKSDLAQEGTVLDQVPSKPVVDHLREFLTSKGFTNAESHVVEEDFQRRLAHEAMMTEPKEDVDLVHSSDAAIVEASRPQPLNLKTLEREARSNGFLLEDNGAGRVILRDVQEPNKIVSVFDDLDKTREFINRSGQTNGTKLDGDAGISTNAASGGRGLPPDDRPPTASDIPYDFFNAPNKLAKDTGTSWLIRGLDNLATYTRNREWTLNVDGKYKTQLYSKVVEPLQRLASARNQQMRPWYDALHKVESGMKGMGTLAREQIGQYIETMSPDQVIQRFMSRPMNPLETALGRQLASDQIDIGRVFKYSRQLEKLKKEFPLEQQKADPKMFAEYNARVEQLKQAYDMDDKHLKAVNLFDSVKSMSKKDASLGAITRLARSITDNEMTREEYAAKNKLTPAQITAANKLEEMYSNLAKAFNIPEVSRLGGYMTHARLYDDGDLVRTMRTFSGDVKAKDFYARLARTGEISAFERDPIKALQRYIKGGFDAKEGGFNDQLAIARNALTEEVKKLPALNQRHVTDVLKQYLDDIRGFPAAADQFAQEAVDFYSDHHKLGLAPEMRKQIVNGILSVIHTSTIGFRPVYGALHWAFSNMISIAHGGLAYTKRANEQGVFAKLHPEVIEQIRAEGGLSTISPLLNYSAEEFEQQSEFSRALGKGVAELTDVAFKVTGIPTIFEMLSSGHYLATKQDAIKLLTKLGREEATWDDVRKGLKLDKHYAPVVQQFGDLARAGKTEAAAQYIATQTVHELVGQFGNATHPYKWGTNWGRLLGQYGNWPLWARSTVTRLASRGTIGQRMSSVAKLAAASWLGVKAGDELGIDLSKMNVLESMFWWGGPLETTFEEVRDALKGTGRNQQDAKRRLLKILPINPKTGELQPSIFVPGSFAIDNIVKGIGDINQGNTVPGAWEVAGGRKQFSIRGGGIP